MTGRWNAQWKLIMIYWGYTPRCMEYMKWCTANAHVDHWQEQWDVATYYLTFGLSPIWVFTLWNYDGWAVSRYTGKLWCFWRIIFEITPFCFQPQDILLQKTMVKNSFLCRPFTLDMPLMHYLLIVLLQVKIIFVVAIVIVQSCSSLPSSSLSFILSFFVFLFIFLLYVFFHCFCSRCFCCLLGT